jgi:hypothetical protein
MDPIVLGAIAVAAALIPVVAIASRRRPAARMSIAEAPEGVLVELRGTIEPGETITAPLTGRACVHYELEIQGPPRNVNRPGIRNLPAIARDARSVAFAISDGTGRALIDPSGARFTIEITERQMTVGAPTERQRELGLLHAMRDGENLFREGVLAVGEQIAVVGIAVREPDPDGAARATGYRGDSPTRLRLGGSPRRALQIRAIRT